ncbi:hypothetical protein TNCT_560201 [Trichonephila clavata]|uniref:Uncharacterized protein n=1 Tax=Trichonephila clavata TaxID=2740835 RepID=A0A8X6FIG3_TRICU|nr:hypothetical protein TNCT_560201 [Trichonephila clavata]
MGWLEGESPCLLISWFEVRSVVLVSQSFSLPLSPSIGEWGHFMLIAISSSAGRVLSSLTMPSFFSSWLRCSSGRVP